MVKFEINDGVCIVPEGVTEIPERTFYRAISLEKVVLPNTLKKIGKEAFQECESLTVVNIPDSVCEIGEKAFDGCEALEEVILPESISEIKSRTFEGCLKLRNINLHDSLTIIGEGAFIACEQVEELYIPASVTNIGVSAFSYCKSLNKITVHCENPVYDSRNNCNAIVETATNTLVAGCYTTEIDTTICAIGERAFEGCELLTQIYIPENVTKIASTAFISCPGIRQIEVSESNHVYDSRNACNAVVETETNRLVVGCTDTTMPDSIRKIGMCAFSNAGFKEIDIPYGVDVIEKASFQYCDELEQIRLPETLKVIQEIAFVSCRSLKNIELPSQLVEIGDEAFAGSGLKEITIPSSVERIGEKAFVKCRSLKKVDCTDGLKEIGSVAFGACERLTSFVVPRTVEKIGDNPFAGSTKLTSIVVDEGNPCYDSRERCNAIVESASNMLVSGCKESFIPDSVKTIGPFAFLDISRLETVVIPDSIEEISEEAFAGCRSLETIALSKNLKHIGRCAFSDCTYITSIDLPESLQTIGFGAFSYCKNLEEITIPQAVREIGDYAFENCFELSKIVVQAGNEFYDSREDCNAIIETKTDTLKYGCKNTVVPDSIKVIGARAFFECYDLETIYLPEGLQEIQESAFEGCFDLGSTILPESVKIADNAFKGCDKLILLYTDYKIHGQRNPYDVPCDYCGARGNTPTYMCYSCNTFVQVCDECKSKGCPKCGQPLGNHLIF